MRLADLAPADRPRERLLALGAGALTDAELLAVFLGSGNARECALATSHRLIRTCGGLRGLLQRPAAEAIALPGLGPARWARLAAALELARRGTEARLGERQPLASPRDSAAYLKQWIGPLPYEVFVAIFLDNRHRVVAREELFRGTLDGTAVYPREVVRRLIAHNAAALIVAHNHPSGIAEPSAADLALTRRLRDALALVEARLLDHFIVGDGEPVSLAERGLI
jgi:DNA repair protein RadC